MSLSPPLAAGPRRFRFGVAGLLVALGTLAPLACATAVPRPNAPPPAKSPSSDAPVAEPAPPAADVRLQRGASVAVGGAPRDDVALRTKARRGDEAAQDAADLVAYLAPLKAEVDAAAQRVVGTLAQPLVRSRDGESTMGNFAADSMREAVFAVNGARADVCFTNMGGLRIDLPQGEVTAGKVVEVMPFDNSIVVFSVRGDRMKTLVAHLAERGDPASGLRYKKSAPLADTTTVGGKALDEKRTYRVCTNDYVFEGGAGYDLDVGTFDVAPTGYLVRDALLFTFEQANHKPVQVQLDGRVQP